MLVDWSKHRRPNGSINLVAAFREGENGALPPAIRVRAEGLLELVENMQPIESRQVAAVAIATTIHLAATGSFR